MTRTRAIRAIRGPGVRHRTSREKHNRIAQDHRAVKQRDYPMRGFGSCASAARFCSACEAQHQDCRAWDRSGEPRPLAARRQRSQARWAAVMAELAAA